MLIFQFAGIFNSFSQINITEEKFGVRICLNNIDFQYVQSNSSDSQVQFGSSGNIVSNTEYCVLLPEIRIILAVQDTVGLSWDFLRKNIEYIGDKKLEGNPYYMFEDDYSIIEPTVKIRSLGKQRGVELINVSILPFQYNPLTHQLFAMNNTDVLIKFPKKINPKNFIDDKLYSFFNSVLNKGHLSTIIDGLKTKKNIPADQILEKDWYDPDKTYVKLTTTRDRLATANLSDIINLSPEFEGIRTDELILLHKGLSYPYYISGDNEIVDKTDKLYFVGKRPSGDTTWYDNFTNEEAFYLCRDTTYTVRSIKSATIPGNIESTITSVIVDQHLETEREYYEGNQIGETPTSVGEGWYLKALTQVDNNNYTDSLFILPDDSNSLEVLLKVVNNDTIFVDDISIFKLPPYKHQLFLNDNIIIDKQFVNQRDQLYQFTNVNIIPGLNKWKLISLPADDERSGRSFIDFLTIRGKAKPFSIAGAADFSTELLINNSNIIVPGFQSEKIYAISQNNDLFYSLDGIAGTSFVIAASNNTILPYSSIYVDNLDFKSNSSGFHIVVSDPSVSGGFKYHYFEFDKSTSLIELLNSIPQGRNIFGLYNSSEQIPKAAGDYFSSIGSKLAASLKVNDVWFFTFRKGVNSVIEKSAKSSGVLSGILNHTDGKTFSADISLEQGKKYNLSFCDHASLEAAKIYKVSKSELKSVKNNCDAVIITHKNFMEPANKLAVHRKSFNDMNVKVIDVDDIYKEFNYGKKNVHALKDFLKHTVSSWEQAPYYVILFGDASRDARKVSSGSTQTDFIPTWGYPTSDYWLGLLDEDMIYDVVVGRLPVRNLPEANSMVEKLITYDTTAVRPWMKRYFWLSGGFNESEMNRFHQERFSVFNDYLTNNDFCGDTLSIRKDQNDVISETKATQIRDEINKGIGWLSFIGHASSEVFDLDGWQSYTLSNYGKYPVFSTISCNSGAYANPRNISRNESYLLEPGKGFVACAGSSGTGFVLNDLKMMNFIMDKLVKTDTRFIGDLIYTGKLNLYWQDVHERLTGYQYTFLGDPLTSLRHDIYPELYTLIDEVSVLSESNNPVISENDEYVVIKGKVHNGGVSQKENVKIQIEREYENNLFTDSLIVNGICLFEGYEFNIPVKDMPGSHRIKITIDPDSLLIDKDYSNNRISFNFDVFTSGLLTLDPEPFWNIDPENPIFRVINPSESLGEFSYIFVIAESRDTNSSPNYISDDSEISDNKTHIDWKPDFRLIDGKSYWLRCRLVNHTKDDKVSSWLIIPFHAGKVQDSIANWSQFSKDQLSENFIEGLTFVDQNGNQVLKTSEKSMGYEIISVAGKWQVGLQRYAFIEFTMPDNKKVTLVNTNWQRGFHLVKVDKYTGDYVHKLYDTWNDADQTLSLIKYLNDSVSVDDYLLACTSDKMFNGPYFTPKEHPAYIDSVRYIFNQFGARAIDTVDTNGSFAFMGWKNANPDDVIEIVNNDQDTARINGSLIITGKTGRIFTDKIGPAKKWNSLKLTGVPYDEYSYSEVIVSGFKFDGSIDTLLSQNYTKTIDLSNIDATVYPYVNLELVLYKNDYLSLQFIDGINLDYIPESEIAVKKIEFDGKDTLLRGEVLNTSITVQNLSLRSTIDNPVIGTKITNRFGNVYYEDKLFTGVILPDQIAIVSYRLNTDDMDPSSKINIILDPELKLNEKYRFNNFGSNFFNIYEDNIKPAIKLFADDVFVNNYDYVSQRPEFKIQIFDNSPLSISDESKLRVKINGRTKNLSNSEYFEYTYHQGQELKLELNFKAADTLDYTIYTNTPTPKGNIIQVFAEDATGNKDTLEYYINVALNGNISDLKTFPNPFISSSNINFNLKLQDNNSTAEISIFNALGQKIRTISAPAKIGENVIEIDAFDNNNNSLPTGTYYYFVRIIGSSYVEPGEGRFNIIR